MTEEEKIKNMTEEERIEKRKRNSELRNFKDDFIVDFFNGSYIGWTEYLEACEDSGLDETEMVYDDMMLAFADYKIKQLKNE